MRRIPLLAAALLCIAAHSSQPAGVRLELSPVLGWVASAATDLRRALSERVLYGGEIKPGDVWFTLELPSDQAAAENVRRAALLLTGTRLEPFMVRSFNEIVGERTAERGFLKATTLFMGVEVSDYGGGICMVSGALYGALMLGGYAVVERHAHSRPRDYMPLGMDAAVNWPDLDLKFFNNRAKPVDLIVRATPWLQVELRSPGSRQQADTEWREKRKIPFVVEERSSPFVKERKLHRRGEAGVSGQRLWTYGRWPYDKEEERSVWVRSVYRAVPEVWLVPSEPAAPRDPWAE